MDKPSITAILRGLAPSLELDDDTHGWKAIQCPWHGDKAASASYNTTLERFRCHACGISGDGYDLIQAVEGCDFQTARAKSAELCGGAFSAGSSVTSHQRSKLTSRRNSSRSKLIRSKYGRSR